MSPPHLPNPPHTVRQAWACQNRQFCTPNRKTGSWSLATLSSNWQALERLSPIGKCQKQTRAQSVLFLRDPCLCLRVLHAAFFSHPPEPGLSGSHCSECKLKASTAKTSQSREQFLTGSRQETWGVSSSAFLEQRQLGSGSLQVFTHGSVHS